MGIIPALRLRLRIGGLDGGQNKTKRDCLLKAIKYQRNKCHLCGLPMDSSKDLSNPMRATADHVIPKSLGGMVKGNINAAHSICNQQRGTLSVEKFKDFLKKTAPLA